ncbi:hypothetical protein ACSBPH_04425 [Microbacterium sp. F51-2R]|uniref:hypothetical protein n=1 Tax=Microbacterium sp. F51-2R TaxID=3445777 RepID=UPI003FA05ECC
MTSVEVEHKATVWMTDDKPARMFYAGRTWRVTDTPTRLRDSIWSSSLAPGCGLYGWRFQATDEAGESFIFDVFKSATDWHVHHAYR